MRCFLACDLSASAKIELDEWRNKALHVNKPVTHVKPANFHITTRFLGNVASKQLDVLLHNLEREFEQLATQPFDIILDNMAVWSKPKIIAAIPTLVPDNLLKLQQISKRASEIASIGGKGNHSVYRPHVTLARKVKAESVAPPLFLPKIATTVTGIHLYESVSGTQGVNYIQRHTFNYEQR